MMLSARLKSIVNMSWFRSRTFTDMNHYRCILVALTMLLALAAFLWPSSALAQEEKDLFTRTVEQHGPVLAGGAALVGGLLTCLTPCVYPMIVITVSIFGAREAKSRREAMLLSTMFVLGIVVLFTTMLVVAALTGGVFGSALANKWVLVGLAAVFVALALSMFGAFDLTLPDSLMQRLSSVGGIGYGGAFLLGLVSGLVAAPCTGPVLLGIMTWIAQTQNVALGAIVGTMFSIGLGIPFWLVGTFAVSLPKGGKWMIGVKSFFGTVMLLMALYFLRPGFPVLATWARPDTTFVLLMIAVAIIGIQLGAVHLDWSDGGIWVKLRKGLGIGAAAVGGFLAWVSYEMPKVPPAMAAEPCPNGQSEQKRMLTWLHEEKEATTKAQAEKRPLLVDFTAEWCGACKEMAKETFADPRVMEKAGHFVAVKIDATDDEDPQVSAVKDKYNVRGLPAVIVYDSTGQEKKRFNEFVGPEKFLTAIEGIN